MTIHKTNSVIESKASPLQLRLWLNGSFDIGDTDLLNFDDAPLGNAPVSIVNARNWLKHEFGMDMRSLDSLVHTPKFDESIRHFRKHFSSVLSELERKYRVQTSGQRAGGQVLWRLCLDLRKRGVFGDGDNRKTRPQAGSVILQTDKSILRKIVPNSTPKIEWLPYTDTLQRVLTNLNADRERRGLPLLANLNQAWRVVESFRKNTREPNAAYPLLDTTMAGN